MKPSWLFPFLLLVVLSVFAVPFSARAGAPPLTEIAKIEALITHVAGLKGATFIRNGSEYDAAAAAKFLRGKWKANEKAIKSASDFIEKAASVSSTSGKSYLIRLGDRKETTSGDYLRARLQLIERSRVPPP